MGPRGAGAKRAAGATVASTGSRAVTARRAGGAAGREGAGREGAGRAGAGWGRTAGVDDLGAGGRVDATCDGAEAEPGLASAVRFPRRRPTGMSLRPIARSASRCRRSLSAGTSGMRRECTHVEEVWGGRGTRQFRNVTCLAGQSERKNKEAHGLALPWACVAQEGCAGVRTQATVILRGLAS